MAERAHPKDPAFQDRWVWSRRFKGLIPWPRLLRSIWKQGLIARYKFCQPYTVGKRVLDVPCGVGWGTSLLRDTRQLVGVDISEEAIQYAQTHFADKAEFQVADMQHLPFADESFDLVTCLEGIEHVAVDVAEQFIREAVRVLSAAGQIILTNPLPDPDRPSNPYHIHEYKLDELDTLVEPWFKKRLREIRTISGVRVIYFVGEVRKKNPPWRIFDTSSRLPRKAREWIRKQYVPTESGFRFSPQSPVCLVGSCCAALASETLGTLSDWSAEEIEAWAHYIQSFQHGDGWFEDPHLQPVKGHVLDSTYLRGHATFLATMALDALGQRPHRRLEFLDAWRDDTALYDWIDHFDWNNPWRESNWVEWIGYWLLAESEITTDDVPLPKERFPVGFAGLMQWLEDHQDRATGFWGNPPYGGSKRTLHQMAAAYHHYVFYYASGQSLRFKDRIVDHTLALQQPDGLFALGRTGGGPCEDLDAIDILANMYRLADYRRGDIQEALKKALAALLRNQRADGAFVYASDSDSLGSLPPLLRTVFRPWHHPGPRSRLRALRQYASGSAQCYAQCPHLRFKTKAGDMFSQWFRPLAIAIAASALGQDRSPVWWHFGFRRQITQGWWPGVSKVTQFEKVNVEEAFDSNC